MFDDEYGLCARCGRRRAGIADGSVCIGCSIRGQFAEHDANRDTAQWIDAELAERGGGGKFPEGAEAHAEAMTPGQRREWIGRHVASAYRRRERQGDEVRTPAPQAPARRRDTLQARAQRIMWGA